MAWIIIIILVIILIIIVRFTSDVKKQNDQVLLEGGMRSKYAELIEYLKAGQGSVLSERASSITVGKSNMDGQTVFVLIQTFKTLSVQWKCKSIMFGNHQLEWEFYKELSQKMMFERIKNGLSLYYKNKLYK